MATRTVKKKFNAKDQVARLRKQERLNIISGLLLENLPADKITERLEGLGHLVNVKTVERDIHSLREQTIQTLQAGAVGNYWELIKREIARCDWTEKLAYDAFMASASERVQKIVKQAAVEGEDGRYLDELQIAGITTITSSGEYDAHLLKNLIDVQKERRKILGVYAAQKLDIREEKVIHMKGYVYWSPDELKKPLLPDGETVEGEFTE